MQQRTGGDHVKQQIKQIGDDRVDSARQSHHLHDLLQTLLFFHDERRQKHRKQQLEDVNVEHRTQQRLQIKIVDAKRLWITHCAGKHNAVACRVVG